MDTQQFIVGDSVTGVNNWSSFDTKTIGVVTRVEKENDDGEIYFYYTVKYKDAYGREQIESYEDHYMKLVGPALPIFAAEFIALGVGKGSVTHRFRAEDMSGAEKVVAELVKGGKNSLGETLPEIMGCNKKKIPADWQDRVVIMYIKQEIR